METQRDEMIELVEKNGWKTTQLDNYDFQKWSMETWLLESIWSPVGVTAYFSLMIDPFSDFQKPYPWAIEVRKEKPVYGANCENLTISLKQWKNEKDDFVKFLAKRRSESEITE